MLGVDLMGPLPKSKKGNVYLLVVVDYFTKWVALFPIRDSKTLQEEVLTRWEVPKFLLSDRGPQFLSQLMEDLCKRWEIIRKLTTSYHPQTNLSERVNRTVRTMIASFVGESHRDWDRWLAEFRFAINTAFSETTGHSPVELALGRQLKGPLELLVAHPPNPEQTGYSLVERQQQLRQDVLKAMRSAHTKQARYYNARRTFVQFQVGDLVWIRAHPVSKADAYFSSKLAPKWDGPVKIKKKLGPVNYLVEWGSGEKVDNVNVVNLKQYFGGNL